MPTMQQALADAGLTESPRPTPPTPTRPQPVLRIKRTDRPDRTCHQCPARATRLITSHGTTPKYACHSHATVLARLARAIGRTYQLGADPRHTRHLRPLRIQPTAHRPQRPGLII